MNAPNTKITHLCFSLSMPSRASWNGRWSGAGRVYFIIRKVLGNAKAQERARKMVEHRGYSYRWSDGWAALVSVRPVDGKEARQLRKKTDGFCGYDWMITSIYEHGAIYASTDEIPTKE